MIPYAEIVREKRLSQTWALQQASGRTVRGTISMDVQWLGILEL